MAIKSALIIVPEGAEEPESVVTADILQCGDVIVFMCKIS